MEERLKELRGYLGLNQDKFAEKIGLGQSTWAMIEVGKRNLNERHIMLICRTFKVNEGWLRSGTGNMFIESPNAELNKILDAYNLDALDKKVIESYIKLSPQERAGYKSWLKMTMDLVKNID